MPTLQYLDFMLGQDITPCLDPLAYVVCVSVAVPFACWIELFGGYPV